MTGQELFETALDLCGLRGSDGTIADDLNDLKQRAPAMINVLLAENAPLASRVEKTGVATCRISALSDTIDMPQMICETVLAYGLARLMCIGDDEDSASRFALLYENAKAAVLSSGRAEIKHIAEVYE